MEVSVEDVVGVPPLPAQVSSEDASAIAADVRCLIISARRVLWTDPEFKWNNFATFKVALRAAWAKVTGGEVGTTYLKKTVGSFEKRRKLCIEAKGGRIKY